MHDEQLDQTRSHGKLMRWGMMACYVVMLLPIGGYFIAGGTISGVWANFGVFTPCYSAWVPIWLFTNSWESLATTKPMMRSSKWNR